MLLQASSIPRGQNVPPEISVGRARQAEPQRGWSQTKAAKAVGVDRSTVSKIESKKNGSDVKIHDTSVPDLRLKVTGAQRRQILTEVEDKKPVKQVAADFGVSERRVRQVGGAFAGVHDTKGSEFYIGDRGIINLISH